MLPIDLPTPLLFAIGALTLLSLVAPILKAVLPQRIELPYVKRSTLLSL